MSTKKVNKLYYPDKPTTRTQINQTYINDYLTANADSITNEQIDAIMTAYSDALTANADDNQKYIKATNAAVKVFCELYYPELIKVRQKRTKLTFLEKLAALKK